MATIDIDTLPNRLEPDTFKSPNWTVAEPNKEIGYRCELRLEPATEGGFVAYVAQLKGIISEGDSEDEAVRNVTEALRAAIAVYSEEGDSVPWAEPERKTKEEVSRWVVVNA